MKVTMVGISGSGKTALMSALNDLLGGGSNISGFHIAPHNNNNSVAGDLLMIGNLAQLSISQNMSFPDGTQKTTLWPFTVRHHSKQVTYFDWIDYRGGILSDIFKPTRNEQEFSELISHIIASNAVILLADSFTLTHYTDIKEARVRSGANIIINLFESFSNRYPHRDLIFVICLTKADAVDEKWKKANYSPLISRGLEVFSPLVQLCKRNPSWVGGIVPISAVGEGRVKRTKQETTDIKNPLLIKDELIGFPQPFNADSVLFFCLGQTLKQMQNEALEMIKKREEELEKLMSQIGVVNTIWSKLTKQPSAKEIAKSIMQERRADYSVLRTFEPYIDPLFNIALEKITIIK